MTRRYILLVGGTLLGSLCFSQTPGLETNQSALGDGQTEFTVKNVSRSAITAVFVTALHTDAAGSFLARDNRWYDSALHGTFWRPLQPGESRSFQATSHPREAKTEFAVRAVAFADGTTHGEWADILLYARKAADRYLGLIRQRLSLAVTAIPARETLLEEMRQLQAEMYAEVDFDHDYLRPKPRAIAIAQVFGIVTGDLSIRGRTNDIEPWPEQVRRVEYRCQSTRRDLEMTEPRFWADSP